MYNFNDNEKLYLLISLQTKLYNKSPLYMGIFLVKYFQKTFTTDLTFIFYLIILFKNYLE
jgi:hypothetical protein